MENEASHSCKRPYELGKRLEQMDRTRAAVLSVARAHLETGGLRDFSMESLAKAAGVTRQTIHNLFGTRTGVLEALFDHIALDAGMDRMREVMTASEADTMLDGFIAVFSAFWIKNRMLLKRIHGFAAVDPEFGKAILARNERRRGAATRVIERASAHAERLTIEEKREKVAALVALTSFEFFDALTESTGSADTAREQLPGLIRRALALDNNRPER